MGSILKEHTHKPTEKKKNVCNEHKSLWIKAYMKCTHLHANINTFEVENVMGCKQEHPEVSF